MPNAHTLDHQLTPQQMLAAEWDIFPILWGKKTTYAHRISPDTNGTEPTKWVDGWQRLDFEKVDFYWSQMRHNVGIATGARSGFWVLDIDVATDTPEEAADYVYEMTTNQETGEEGLLVDLDTLIVQTASGKWQFYYEMPDGSPLRNSASKIAPLVDVRGNGGMVMGPGSVVEGSARGVYTVYNFCKPATAPVEVYERALAVSSASDGERAKVEGSIEKQIDVVASRVARGWLDPLTDRLKALPREYTAGHGAHDVCFEVACELAEFAQSPWFDLTLDEALDLYRSAAPRTTNDRGRSSIYEWGEGVKKTAGQGKPLPEMNDAVADAGAALFESKPAVIDQEGNPVALQAAISTYAPAPIEEWDIAPLDVVDSTAPYSLAASILGRVPRFDGRPVLTCRDDGWWVWMGSHWEGGTKHQEMAVRSHVALSVARARTIEVDDDGKMRAKPLNAGMGKINDIIGAGVVPILFRQQPREIPNGIPLRSGILDPKTREHTPASPRLWNTFALPFEYDAEATCPEWDLFLKETFAHDPAAVEALQEWFGYALVQDPEWMQKMFWILGPRRSGKGTILKVLHALFGRGAVPTTLGTLAEDFGKQNLIKAGVAIIDDARDPDPRVAHRVTEFLLAYTSGGAVPINQKNRDQYEEVLRSTLWAASNTLPRFPDEGNAIASRVEIIKTKKSHSGEEDRGLLGRLLQELPGILNWALDGLDRLRTQGERPRFTQAESAAELLADVERGATSATPLIKDYLIEVDAKHGLTPGDLKNLANWWSTEQADDYKPNALAINAAIKAEFQDAKQDKCTPYGAVGSARRKGWRGVWVKCCVCEEATPATHLPPPAGAHGPLCQGHYADWETAHKQGKDFPF